jgi:hypothetical protein
MSFSLTEINRIFLMSGLENLALPDYRVDLITPNYGVENSVLPDCRVDLKTLLDDRVDLLIVLRFS